jgi:UDP-2-acetamido-2-deoxy-ribo-hexuluronate aminotransferase
MNFIDLVEQYRFYKNQIDSKINDVLLSGQYIQGSEVKNLEKELEDYCGARHCISVANGTDAIQIALMALNLKPGDEIICPSHTWISTASAAAILGLKVRFIDVDIDTFNICTDDLKSKITDKTRAIIAVSIYGQCPDINEINSIAIENGIAVIEDAAQSFGSTYLGKKSCNLTDIATTSFFPTKPLGCYGDGGAIFTSDSELAEKINMISKNGQKVRHKHEVIGMNSRLDAIQASILNIKLKNFDNEITLRRQAATYYNNALKEYSGFIQTPIIDNKNESVYAQYVIKSPKRDELKNRLEEKGIPTVIYYPTPVHMQPMFADNYQTLPNTEKLMSEMLALPFSSFIKESDQELVVNAIIDVINS